MSVRSLRSAPIFLVLSALALVASAQSRLPPGVDSNPGATAAMATRSVSHYLDLERALADAAQANHRDAVAPMLTADFELRTSESLDAVAGVDSLLAQMRHGGATARVRDLAVLELAGVAVVSFFLDVGGRGRGPASTLYVVDVWQSTDGKLAARYVTRPAHALSAPARPRGRE